MAPHCRKWVWLVLVGTAVLPAGCGKKEEPARTRRPRARRRKQPPKPARKAKAAADTSPPKAAPPTQPAAPPKDPRSEQIAQAIEAFLAAPENSPERAEAEKALDGMGMEAVGQVSAVLKGPDLRRADTMLCFFPRGDQRDAAIVPAVLEQFRGPLLWRDGRLYFEWASEVSMLPKGPAALLGLLDDPNLCAQTLKAMHWCIQTPELIEAKDKIAAKIASEDVVVRACAGVLLHRLDPLDARAVPGLCAAVTIPDVFSRTMAIEGIGVLGPAAAEAAEPLARYIALGEGAFVVDPTQYPGFFWEVSKPSRFDEAIAALEAIGPGAGKAVPILAKAAVAGGEQTEDACKALLALHPKELELPHEQLAQAYIAGGGNAQAEVLGLCGAQGAVALVQAWASTPAKLVGTRGMGVGLCLKRAGAEAAEAVPFLLPLTLSDDAKMVESAGIRIADIGAPAAEPLAKVFAEQYQAAKSHRTERRSPGGSPRATDTGVRRGSSYSSRSRSTANPYTYTAEGEQARKEVVNTLSLLAGLRNGAAAAVPTVLPALRDRDPDIFAKAMTVLTNVEDVPPTVASTLLAVFRDKSGPLSGDRNLQASASRLLVRGASSRPTLLRTASNVPGVSLLPAMAKHPSTNPTCAHMIVAMMKGDSRSQTAGIAALKAMGTAAMPAAAYLRQMARGKGRDGTAARYALLDIDPTGEVAVEIRIARFDNPSSARGRKEDADKDREELLPYLDSVLPVVLRHARQGDPKKQERAFRVLRKLGPVAAGAKETLQTLARVPPATDSASFSDGAQALAALAAVAPQDEATLELVTQWLTLGRDGDKPPPVTGASDRFLRMKVEAGADALKEMGRHGAGAYPMLVKIAEEGLRGAGVYQGEPILQAFLHVTRELGPDVPGLSPALIDHLANSAVKESRGRYVDNPPVLETLSAMGPAAAPAGPRLLEVFKEHNRLFGLMQAICRIGVQDYPTAVLQRDGFAAAKQWAQQNTRLVVEACGPSAEATAGLLRLAREWDPNAAMAPWVLAALMRTAVPAAELADTGATRADIEAGLDAVLRVPDPLQAAHEPYLRCLLLGRQEAIGELVDILLKPARAIAGPAAVRSPPSRFGPPSRTPGGVRGRSPGILIVPLPGTSVRPRGTRRDKGSAGLTGSQLDHLRIEAAVLLRKLGAHGRAWDRAIRRLHPFRPAGYWRVLQELEPPLDRTAPAVLRARPSPALLERPPVGDLLTGAAGEDRGRAVAYLTWRLKVSRSADVLRALLHYKLPPDEVLALLAPCLERSREDTLLVALQAAGKMGPRARGLVERIGYWARHGKKPVQEAAKKALKRIEGAPEAAGDATGAPPPTSKPTTSQPGTPPTSQPGPKPKPTAGARKSEPAAAGRLRMANMMLNAGQSEKGIEILRQIVINHAGSLEADRAATRLKELGETVPGPTTAPQPR